jgi:hypothetical protein
MRDIKQIRVVCEDEPRRSFVVATTMWDPIHEEVGIRREEELKADKAFFKFFADTGVSFMRHPGSSSRANSAREIIFRLINKEEGVDQDRRGRRLKAFKVARPSAAARLLARLLGYLRAL